VQRFCQSELECRRAHSLWVAAAARLRMAGAHSRSLSERPAQLSSLSQSNSSFDLTRLARPPTKHTDGLLLLPTFQQTFPDKTKFSGSQVQRFSLRLVFLPHIRFTAKSAAAVGSSCQSRLCSAARLINQNRAALASAPLGSAPEMDSASLRSLPRQL
jgi:hypothetical protein